jgi:hypothetical protein
MATAMDNRMAINMSVLVDAQTTVTPAVATQLAIPTEQAAKSISQTILHRSVFEY